MQQTSDQLRSWFRNVEPICAELFNAAHAMCGNYDLAEYALRSAILDVWLQNAGSGMGFRERLRGALRREAFEAALGPGADEAEFTWPGIPSPRDGEPILSLAAQERLETQRLLVLRYGCGLSLRAVTQLTGVSQAKVRSELERFETRCRRSLSGQDRSRAEALIARRMKRMLGRPAPGNPQPGQIYRAFEAEAGGAQLTEHRVSRVVTGALAALLALACAGAFWLFAVLSVPH
ncbi:MAG: hypothetical protein Q4C10_00545 [Clostridia bacterium]|nr:hypothetical protein [Clostridia bacterium]